MNNELLNAVRELIEIAQEEMSSEWSREFIEKKLSKYTSLLKELKESHDTIEFQLY